MGLLAGLILFLLFYLLGAALFARITPSQNSLPVLLASLGGGLGGSFLTTMKKPKYKKKR
jgi:hypothetical protein